MLNITETRCRDSSVQADRIHISFYMISFFLFTNRLLYTIPHLDTNLHTYILHSPKNIQKQDWGPGSFLGGGERNGGPAASVVANCMKDKKDLCWKEFYG